MTIRTGYELILVDCSMLQDENPHLMDPQSFQQMMDPPLAPSSSLEDDDASWMSSDDYSDDSSLLNESISLQYDLYDDGDVDSCEIAVDREDIAELLHVYGASGRSAGELLERLMGQLDGMNYNSQHSHRNDVDDDDDDIDATARGEEEDEDSIVLLRNRRGRVSRERSASFRDISRHQSKRILEAIRDDSSHFNDDDDDDDDEEYGLWTGDSVEEYIVPLKEEDNEELGVRQQQRSRHHPRHHHIHQHEGANPLH